MALGLDDLAVGHWDDPVGMTGCTVVLPPPGNIASVSVRGGGPGTRETDIPAPHAHVQGVAAILLTGGSTFGLAAATGVVAWCEARGIGYDRFGPPIPIVPAAVLFDLLNGGVKTWGRFAPYCELGYAAVAAAERLVRLGSAGAGFGATTVNLRGGLGSASARTSRGHVVGALVAVNPAGQVTIGDGPHFWAAPYEMGHEFGGLGWPSPLPPGALAIRTKRHPTGNTTIAVVATDAALTKPQAKRLAVMAQDGLARAIRPVHTPLEGDTVFAASTRATPLADPVWGLAELGTLAADTLARAVARGVYEAASSAGFDGLPPAWRDRFGQ